MQQAITDNQNFIYYLFNLTAGLLYGLSMATGLSYQFWNILIWFGLMPASFIYLVSRRTSKWLNLASLPIFVYLFYFARWKYWFDKAVVLLYKIGDIIHADYKVTSVIICDFLPIAIYGFLIYFVARKRFKLYCYIMLGLMLLIVLLFPVSNYIIQKKFG